MIRIDSHQHFWDLNKLNYKWLTEDMAPIYRNFLPDDLHEHLKAFDIQYTILVQAAPTIEETEFLLELFEQHDFIAGVVGWIDMESDTFKEDYNRLRNHKGFIGIRPMLEDLEDQEWILRPKVKDSIKILLEDDFPIDLLISTKQLPIVLELLSQFPTLRAVINHAAKPNITAGLNITWEKYILEIANYKNTMCKLSGLVTETKNFKWDLYEFKPFINHLIKSFGTKRIMFGSDWPVCLLAGSYKDVYSIARKNLDILSDGYKNIFGQNAMDFYKISKWL